MSKKVLLLGASGMLGRALKLEFESQGFTISAPSSKELDLMSYSAVSDYFLKFKNQIDYVIHTAGLVGGLYHNLDNNDEFYFANSTIGSNVAEAMIIHSVPAKILYFGSSCMYRADLIPPYKEENLFDEIPKDKQDNWGYARAKQEVARFILDKKLGSVIIPPNLFGQRRLSDTNDINNKHLLETIAFKYALTRQVDFKCPPEIRREILSAIELAKICVKHLDSLLEKPIAINVGCGYSVSIEDIADRLTGAEISFDDKAYSSLKDKFMDVSKFETLTGEKLKPFRHFKEYLNTPFTID